MARLRDAGYRLVVVSNQGGVARGVYDEADVEAVHRRIADLLDAAAGGTPLIDRFYFCPYHPQGTVERFKREHPWRKPSPGMLLQAGEDLDLNLDRSWFIGDQLRDVAAGRSAGCSTILISRDPEVIRQAGATAVVASLPDAVEVILKKDSGFGIRDSGAEASCRM